MNKIKVAWICHFSNIEVRGILSLTKRKQYHDFAPWITNLAKCFEKRDDIELHVIAPHRGMTKLTQTFEIRGIHYHIYKPDLPILHKNWPYFLPLHKWTNYARNRILVHKFINTIKPDIVNLYGAENDYYSITALGIKNIPVYVCIQGIYSNPNRFNNLIKPIMSRVRIERRIHKECKYFGIFPPFFADLIKRDNDNPILLRQSYIPKTNIEIINDVEKKYDFAFWGRVTDVKGIDKIIDALGYINKNGRGATLSIIGQCGKAYKNYLEGIIKKLNLKGKVFFSGNLPTLQDVHKKALEAKVTVISSKFENLPGTIIESVMLGQPVAATAVGGIPFLNKNGKTILLSEYGDIKGLAENMLILLDNPKYAKELTEKCHQFILKEFDGNTIVDRYIKQYHAIMSHYKFGIEIPTELLYDRKYFDN